MSHVQQGTRKSGIHIAYWLCPVALQLDVFQEDLYPMTPGKQAAITAQEWLSGINKGEWCFKIRHEELSADNDFISKLEPVLMSLKPGLRVANPYQESHFGRGTAGSLISLKSSIFPARASALKANLIEEVSISMAKKTNKAVEIIVFAFDVSVAATTQNFFLSQPFAGLRPGATFIPGCQVSPSAERSGRLAAGRDPDGPVTNATLLRTLRKSTTVHQRRGKGGRSIQS